MLADKILTIDSYDDFGVRNMYRFRGEFEHPWFFDTDRHRLMEEFSEDFVHLRSAKTGEIFQFRLDLVPTFRKPGILITSTEQVTFCVIAPTTGKPSIQKTVNKYLKAGAEKPSKTAYNGIVKFGAYIKEQADFLSARLKLADSEFTDESLYQILVYLRRRADARQ